MSERTQFLVYLLVDDNNRIHYVGRGTHDRAMSHGADDGNPGIAEAFQREDLHPLVLDCETEQAMIVTEGALIDALTRFKPIRHLENRRRDKYRFSPSRVPREFASRQRDEPLDPTEVAKRVGGPVMYVCIKEGTIRWEGRGVIDPMQPDAGAIANRIEESWWLDKWLQLWGEHPEYVPKCVVGLAGTKQNRYILGALDVAGVLWPQANGRPGTFYSIPWKKVGQRQDVTVSDIDAYGLCGYRMTGVAFQSNRAFLMRVYDGEGQMIVRP